MRKIWPAISSMRYSESKNKRTKPLRMKTRKFLKQMAKNHCPEEKGGRREKRTLAMEKKEIRKVSMLRIEGRGIGQSKKTGGIIGFCRSITIISFVKKWGGLIRFLKPWQPSLELERQNNAGATIKKWRKNIILSPTFSCTWEKVTTQQRTQVSSTKIWRQIKWKRKPNLWRLKS